MKSMMATALTPLLMASIALAAVGVVGLVVISGWMNKLEH